MARATLYRDDESCDVTVPAATAHRVHIACAIQRRSRAAIESGLCASFPDLTPRRAADVLTTFGLAGGSPALRTLPAPSPQWREAPNPTDDFEWFLFTLEAVNIGPMEVRRLAEFAHTGEEVLKEHVRNLDISEKHRGWVVNRFMRIENGERPPLFDWYSPLLANVRLGAYLGERLAYLAQVASQRRVREELRNFRSDLPEEVIDLLTERTMRSGSGEVPFDWDARPEPPPLPPDLEPAVLDAARRQRFDLLERLLYAADPSVLQPDREWFAERLVHLQLGHRPPGR